MKFKLHAAAALAALFVGAGALPPAIQAQQLPNASFEEDWVDCTPWTSGATKTVGKTPSPWVISNVAGYQLGFWYGTTTVGTYTEGYNSPKCVLLKSADAVGNPVPGYISLGTTWNTATPSQNNKDGGVFGGIEFTNRPDAVTFMYKRTHKSGGSNEIASLIAYSWRGTTTQVDVPGNIAGSPKKVTMTDRDRNILGITTAEGGAVTYSSDFELVASKITAIEGDQNSWTPYTFEIDYKSDKAPQKFNIVISANDYWSADNVFTGNALYVDDVKLLYYSRLQSLSIDGANVEGFAPDTYTYTVKGAFPGEGAPVVFTRLGQSGMSKVTVNRDFDTATYTVTVSNDYEDADGKKEHIYTVKYLVPVESVAWADNAPSSFEISRPGTNLAGALTLTPEMLVIAPSNAAANTVEWTVENNDGVVTAAVENGSLTLTALQPGTVTVKATVDGQTAERTITVTPKALTSLSLNPVALFAGMTRTMTAADVTFEPADAYDREVTWSLACEDGSVTLEGSTLTAVTTGGASLTAAVGEIMATVGVSVSALPVEPTGVTLDHETLTLYAGGETAVLIATVAPADANTVKSIDWSSSDDEVATVAADGSVTPVAKGTATVTVTVTYTAYNEAHESTGEETITAECTVTVRQPATGVAFDAESVTIARGETAAVVAHLLPENADEAEITYTVADEEIATVAADGTVTAVAKGETELTAACGEFTATCKIIVNVPLTALTLAPETLDVETGTPGQLTVTATPEDADLGELIWTVADETVVTVAADGTVTALAAGTTTVTVSCGEIVSNEAVITATLYPGVTYTYEGKVTLTTEDGKDVSYNTVTVTTTSPNAATLTLVDYRHGGIRYGDIAVPVTFDSNAALEGEKALFSASLKDVEVLNGSILANMTIEGNTHVERGDLMCEFTAEINVPDYDDAHCSVAFTTYPDITPIDIKGYKTWTWGYTTEEVTDAATIRLIPDRKEKGLFTIVLPGWRAADAFYGDITIPDQKLVDDGRFIYVSVTEYRTVADDDNECFVSLNFEIDREGVSNGDFLIRSYKFTNLVGKFSTVKPQGDVPDDPSDPKAPRTYDGTLDITMAESVLTENAPAQVIITPNGDGTCTFKLPDFKLDLGGEPMDLGDIVVENVKEVADGEGGAKYTGAVSGLSLMGGALIADVDLIGNVYSNGRAAMLINVVWEGIPVTVKFNGNGPAPVNPAPDSVETTGVDGQDVWYTLQGVRVAADSLNPGFYVVRRGGESRTVLVK